MKQLLLWAGVLVLALQPVMAQTADKAPKEKSKKGGSVAEQIEKLSDEGGLAAKASRPVLRTLPKPAASSRCMPVSFRFTHLFPSASGFNVSVP